LYHPKSKKTVALFFPTLLGKACRDRIREKASYFDVLGGTKKCGAIVGLQSHKGQKMKKKRKKLSKIIF
jgi:hypothetical protein